MPEGDVRVTAVWTAMESQPLSEGAWTEGEVASGETVYYRFSAVSGSAYRVWWNDSYQGDGSKTADIIVSAFWLDDNSSIFSERDSGYTTGETFTASKSGYVVLEVQPYSAGSAGTFAVKYESVPTYTVVYDANGAMSGSVPASQTKTYGTSLTLQMNSGTLARTGYAFAGWNTQADGGGTTYSAGGSLTSDLSTTAGATVTLYAKWMASSGSGVPDGFVYIPAGTFTMGSPTTEIGRESIEIQHTVTISRGFYMGKYEVTQAEFEDVMGQLPDLSKSYTYNVGDNYPMHAVSWYDAIAYCNKKSVSEGLEPAYTVSGISDWASLAYTSIPTSSKNSAWSAASVNTSANGYRLPTEAEWEYACRAGTTTAFNNGKNTINHSEASFYPYDDGCDENPTATFIGKSTLVGSYAPNAWGLYDMHGNVWEWCWDWYGSYTSAAQTDPAGASSGTHRVKRGANLSHYAKDLRAAYRDYDVPYDRYEGNGLRLLRPGLE